MIFASRRRDVFGSLPILLSWRGCIFLSTGLSISVGSNYLTQGELYRLGLLTTGFCLLTFLVLERPGCFSSHGDTGA